MKTSELRGAVLDWAVEKIELSEFHSDGIGLIYRPSEDWETAGPIIERERINLRQPRNGGSGDFVAYIDCGTGKVFYKTGATALEAAMRCFVGSKLGEEIEVPEELG